MSIHHASLSHWYTRFFLPAGKTSHRMTKTCMDKPAVTRCFPFSPLLSAVFISRPQPRPASGACVGGHGAGGKGALHLRMGLLHGADCVHPQGRAHARHRLPGLWPRGTGTTQTHTHDTVQVFRCVLHFATLPIHISTLFTPEYFFRVLHFTIIYYGDIKAAPYVLIIGAENVTRKQHCTKRHSQAAGWLLQPASRWRDSEWHICDYCSNISSTAAPRHALFVRF